MLYNVVFVHALCQPVVLSLPCVRMCSRVMCLVASVCVYNVNSCSSASALLLENLLLSVICCLLFEFNPITVTRICLCLGVCISQCDAHICMHTVSSGCVLGCYVNNMLLRNGNCY